MRNSGEVDGVKSSKRSADLTGGVRQALLQGRRGEQRGRAIRSLMKRLAGWGEADTAVGRLALLDGDAAQQFDFL